jgi:hypothetical protein
VGQSTYVNAASIHPEPLSTPEEQPESLPPPDKGFRFFYFEEDLVFNVTTSQPDTTSTAIKSRPAPVLQSAIPTAHLFLNPQVNLLPSISLISTILSLSPTSSISPSPSTEQQPSEETGGIDFSWLGGVVIHFGSESQQTIARLADWKLTKSIGQETLSISIGKVEILSSTGSKILSLEKSRRLNVLLLPDLLQVSLPEVQLMVDVGGVETLQPLVKAMKQAWLESLQHMDTVETEEPEDDEWNEDLLVENIPPSSSSGRNIQIDIQRVSVQLQTDDGTIQFAIDEINTRVHPSLNNIIEFSKATVSIPTIPKPLLVITKSDSNKSMLDFVTTGHQIGPGFLINGAQGILDDFLVGDTSRSDDAWGMIRSDAANNSSQYIKIKIPRINIQVSDSKDINAVKKVFSRIKKTMKIFMEESTVVELEKEDDQIDLVVEFALEEGKVAVKLDENEIFEGRWEGVEGTLVNGVAGGEMVGVIEVAKLQVDVTSPQSPRKVLHESINRVRIP